ncbi:unnamed protein product [Moneuplotes crassus]|uniref:Uncharacterized protein n=1 Tax=Euplotes crassus TaxID=5936 RepID=A0AAD1Y6Y2_EUPCR|nr:unnamed protein product [Moneuplotes crassus]
MTDKSEDSKRAGYDNKLADKNLVQVRISLANLAISLGTKEEQKSENVVSLDNLAKRVSNVLKKLQNSKKLNSIKKQRDNLMDKLDKLLASLQTHDSYSFESIPRFQGILIELNNELPYIERHIERMDRANVIKRAFIKKNVTKKFKEISERISGVTRTINIFEVNEQTDFGIVEKDIKDVQLQMDKLADNIKENNEKRDLDKVIRQPTRPRNKKSTLGIEEKKSVDSTKGLGSAIPKNTKAEQLLLDGHCYFYGEGTKKNFEKAVDLYEESAKLGDLNACMALGDFYESDLQHRADYEMAAYYYKIAADLNQPYALYKTGYFIEKGFHNYNTDDEARIAMFRSYKAAMELGNTEATLRYAQIYEKGEHSVKVDKDRALKIYEEVSFDDQALNSIGAILYERGQYKRSAEYFRKASEKGNIESISNLGICYELGRGAHKDVNRAYELYEDAAKRENPQAMSNLGYLLYKKGKVSKAQKVFLEAAMWFRMSITEDYSIRDSHFYLGSMHHNGEGVDKCYKSAFKYYKAAADLGHDIACEKLGNLCYSGYGCIRPDKTKSFQWYTLGADRGNTQCLNNMGLMVESGFDAFIPDPVKAEECYQKAHENHNTDATFNLGLLYLNSHIFDTSEEEATQLIYNAAMGGNTKAQNHLINIGYVNNKIEFISKVPDEEIYDSEDEYEEEESEEEDIVKQIDFTKSNIDVDPVAENKAKRIRKSMPNIPYAEKDQAEMIKNLPGQIKKNKDMKRLKQKEILKAIDDVEKENSILSKNLKQDILRNKDEEEEEPQPKVKNSEAINKTISKNKPKVQDQKKKDKVVKQKKRKVVAV